MGVREALVEEELYHLIRTVLKKHNYKIHGVEFRGVEPQFRVDGGRADLVLVLRDGTRLLEIECKRKVDVPYGFRAIRDFDPMGSRVINQALGYAVRIGSHAFATTNGGRFALFRAPEAGEPFRLDTHRLLVKEKTRLEEKDIEEILLFVAQWYVKVPVRLIDIDWLFISRLRSFVYFLSEKLRPVVKRLEKDESFSRKLNEFTEKVGSISSEQLAREAAYLLMNKLVFYKILERHYRDLPKLKPISAPDGVSFIEFLRRYFGKAIEVTRDFEPVFITGLYDEIPLPDLDYVFDEVNSFIEEMDTYRLEEVGSDIVGYIYEELIPAEERHKLGQFYTPPPIAELIVNWAVRNPKDIVMDPAVGSGTFLVKAYKRLMELKLDYYRRRGMKKRPAGLHREILSQLYADDINPFPAHLTAMNLAMRDVRYPTSEMNVIVEDFFDLGPKQRILAPYVVRTPAGEVQRSIILPRIDAIVANPPYTRWIEIPGATKKAIDGAIGDVTSKYGLTGGIRGVVTEAGIYIYFIIHASNFLKDGARLGMIISNAWLQTDYGTRFVNFLLDNFKIKAIIDFSNRLFRIPLISTCVLLLEKCSEEKERKNNKTLFVFVDQDIAVQELLDIIEKPEICKGRLIANLIRQADLPRDRKWIQLLFASDRIEKLLISSGKLVPLSQFFHIYRGNTEWARWAYEHSLRPNLGPGDFFYLTEDTTRQYGLKDYANPALTSVRYAKFFTFTKEDWEEISKRGAKCYFFMCHEPKSKLPDNVAEFIEWGETDCKTTVRGSRGGGKVCSQSWVCETRKNIKKTFYGWYDLGGVINTPLFAVRHSRYRPRFVLVRFPSVALYDATIALIPKVELEEKHLKALVTYLNSTFGHLYIEAHGRVVSVGPIAFEMSQAEKMPILDVRRLTTQQIDRLAELFDKLEHNARQVGGANKRENLEKLKPIFHEIDRYIAEIANLPQNLVSTVEEMAETLMDRRLSGAKARPETIGGEEKPKIKPPKKKERKLRRKEPSAPLTRWIPLEKTE